MPVLNTPNFIFHNALDFFEIGKQRTKEIFKVHPCENHYLWYHISAPAVNLAFSLELMLKTIILIEAGEINDENKKHTLVDLFTKISVTAKEELISNFIATPKSNYPAVRFSRTESEKFKKKDFSKSTEEIILELLRTHNRSFVSWRYSFELSQIDNKTEKLDFNFGEMIRLIEATMKYLEGRVD